MTTSEKMTTPKRMISLVIFASLVGIILSYVIAEGLFNHFDNKSFTGEGIYMPNPTNAVGK